MGAEGPGTAGGGRRSITWFGAWFGVWFGAGLSIALAACLPLVVLGGDAYFVIHDNLDHLGLAAALAQSGSFFSLSRDAVVPAVMDGLPRSMLPGPLDVWTGSFCLLKPLAATMVNIVAIHLVAYVGMFLLLSRHVVRDAHPVIPAGVAAIYALLPVFPNIGLSVHALAILVNSVLNCASGRVSKADYVVLAAFPLWSVLPITGVFALAAMALWLAVEGVRRRALHRGLFTALAILTVSYAVVNLPLIREVLFPGGVRMHRVEFSWASSQETLAESVNGFVQHVWMGRSNAESFPQAIWIAVAVAMVVAAVRRSGDLRVLAAGVGVALLLAGVYVVWRSQHFGWWRAIGGALGGLKLHRPAWFLPLVLYALFARALRALGTGRVALIAACALLALQSVNVLWRHEVLRANVAAATGIERIRSGSVWRAPFTWREFYAESLFSQVHAAIARPPQEYRVVSLAFHPSVSMLNGFWSLDGYTTNYPLEYKHRFRRIIAPELERDERLRERFDGWGSRCYVYTREVGRVAPARVLRTDAIEELRIDVAALREMGGDYVISALEVRNAAEIGLDLQGHFSDPETPFHVYLYATR